MTESTLDHSWWPPGNVTVLSSEVMTSGGNSKLFEMISCSRSMLWAVVWWWGFQTPKILLLELLGTSEGSLGWESWRFTKCLTKSAGFENMLISPFNWFTPKICLLLLFDLSFFFSLQSVHRFNAGCKKTTCIWNFLFWVQWATLFIFCGLHSDKLPTLQHLSCLCLACPPPPNPFWVGTLASAKPSIKAVISWSYDQATQKTGRLVKFRSSCCFWRIHKKNIRRSLVKRISYFCWSLFSSFNKKPN